MVWKMLFEEYQDGCLSAWPFLICDRMFLAILNLHVAGRISSSFCLRQFMGLKVIFEEYQDVFWF